MSFPLGGKHSATTRAKVSASLAGNRNGLKHGHTRGRRPTPTYSTWQGMWRRCSNTSASNYARYGGRGIRVCERWRDYRNFLADMGEKPPGLTIDRVDNGGNYEPGNCQCATPSEQRQNQRATPR